MRLIQDHPERAGYLLNERVFDIATVVDALRRIVDGETVIAPTIVARAIATRLFVTERTVEAHVTRILLKLGLAESPDQHRRVLAVLTSSGLSRLTLWTTLRAGTGHLPLRN